MNQRDIMKLLQEAAYADGVRFNEIMVELESSARENSANEEVLLHLRGLCYQIGYGERKLMPYLFPVVALICANTSDTMGATVDQSIFKTFLNSEMSDAVRRDDE